MMASLLVCGAALAAMIALTQPIEAREGRRWRIAVSLPLIGLITVSAAMVFFSFLNELNFRGIKAR